MKLTNTGGWRIVKEYGYKRAFRVVDENGDIAIGKYGYKGRLEAVRYSSQEAAKEAIEKWGNE